MLLCGFGDLLVRIRSSDFGEEIEFAHKAQNLLVVHRRLKQFSECHIKGAIPDFPTMRIVDAFEQQVIFIVLFFANGVLFHFLQPSRSSHFD